jgi:hypothetical protein
MGKVMQSMADNVSKGKTNQNKGKVREELGKITKAQSELFAPKACPTCQNPRWDKTARNT